MPKADAAIAVTDCHFTAPRPFTIRYRELIASLLIALYALAALIVLHLPNVRRYFRDRSAATTSIKQNFGVPPRRRYDPRVIRGSLALFCLIALHSGCTKPYRAD